MIHWLDQTKIKNKKALMRVDLNLPIHNDQLLDDSRIKIIQKSLHYLMQNNCKIILLTHYKRPKPSENPNEWDLSCSTRQLSKFLENIFRIKINYLDKCYGKDLKKTIDSENCPDVFLLENLRFYPGEKENNYEFAKKISELGDIYVNEAFSCSHREHASIMQLPQLLPSYGGIHFHEEVDSLKILTENMQHPSLFILGGSKFSTKLPYVSKIASNFDYVFVAGVNGNTLLKYKGYEIGQSIYEQDVSPNIKSFLHDTQNILLPIDVVINGGTIRSINEIGHNETILDIGPKTVAMLEDYLPRLKTIFWNGPLGYIELPEFRNGSLALAQNIGKNPKIDVIIGGGETLMLMQEASIQVKYASTAGGALLHYLAHNTLPGLKALGE